MTGQYQVLHFTYFSEQLAKFRSSYKVTLTAKNILFHVITAIFASQSKLHEFSDRNWAVILDCNSKLERDCKLSNYQYLMP